MPEAVLSKRSKASGSERVTLGVVQRLLDGLHTAEIAYCHWKSNEHLPAALSGETDLDLLVDRGAGPLLDRVLAEAGFRRFAVQPGHGYTGIEDYLALDPPTGKLVHLHLHHQLTVGESYLKGYHLPWEEQVLSTRVLDDELEIYTAAPHVESVLLMVRLALKLRGRDLISSLFGGRYPTGGALREIHWLAERVEPKRLLEVGRQLVGAEAARRLATLARGPRSAWEILRFRRRIVPRLREYRSHGPLIGRASRWRRELRDLSVRFRRRYLNSYPSTKRIVPRGGVIIALIGADGSGKSTISREITRWLSWKVDILPLYLGSGSGPVSLLRRPLLLYGKLRSLPFFGGRRRRGHPRGDEAPAGVREPPNRPALSPLEARRLQFRRGRQLWHALWAWTLYREKRARLERARRARGRGRVVLCDRYPQDQVMGFSDGPLLSHWTDHRSRIARLLARREAAVYRAASTYPPDLVVRLVAAPEIAWRRKLERSLESVRERVEAVRGLRFPAGTRVVDIDANQPLDQVLLEVKRVVWECL
jgi:thymidylate kinase